MVLVLFFLTYQLSCGMRYLILSVPMSLLVRVSVKFIEICNKVVLSLGCNSRVKETV